MKRTKAKKTKKNLKDFLLNDEGKIMKKNIASMGVGLVALLAMFQQASAVEPPPETIEGGAGIDPIYVPDGAGCPELYEHNSVNGTTAHTSHYVATSTGGHQSSNSTHYSYCEYVGYYTPHSSHASGGGGGEEPPPVEAIE